MEYSYLSHDYLFLGQIAYKNVKRISIRARDGMLLITSPLKAKRCDIDKLVDDNYLKLIKMINSTKKKNEIHYFGKKYDVQIILDKKSYVEISNDVFVIHTTNDSNEKVKSVIYSFYKKNLEAVINLFIDEAKLYYIPFPKIEYRYMKSMFGNYKRINHTITLSLILAKYEHIYIKQVLYHELTHTIVFDHSARFYLEFEKRFPNCKKIQHELRMKKYLDLF